MDDGIVIRSARDLDRRPGMLRRLALLLLELREVGKEVGDGGIDRAGAAADGAGVDTGVEPVTGKVKAAA